MKKFLFNILIMLFLVSCDTLSHTTLYDGYFYLGEYREVSYIHYIPHYRYNSNWYVIPERYRYRIKHFDRPFNVRPPKYNHMSIDINKRKQPIRTEMFHQRNIHQPHLFIDNHSNRQMRIENQRQGNTPRQRK